ncbi:MAG: hypothetical protein ACLR2E_04825 [Lachnospiraceae bacterium]
MKILRFPRQSVSLTVTLQKRSSGGKDIMCYYFNLKDKDTIIDGTAGNAIQNVTKGSSQD